MLKKALRIGFWLLGSIILGASVYFALNYALGRNITTDGIQTTGTIKLNIVPQGSFTVLLDEQKVNPINREIIDNVTPGEHKIRIQQEGFNSWEQIIQVNAGLVTDVSLQLFPQTFQVEQITRTNVDRVYFSRSKRYVYYVVQNSDIGNSIGIWRQSLQENNIPLIEEAPQKIANLTEEIKSALDKNKLTLKPAPGDSRLLVMADGKMYVMSTNAQNNYEDALINSIPYPVTDVNWLNDTNLVISSPNLLFDYNVDTRNSTLITYSQAQIQASQSSSSVFYVRGNELYQYRPGNAQKIKLENVTLPSDISSVIAGTANDNNLILSTKAAKHYFLSLDNSLLTELGTFSIKSVSSTLQNLIVEQDGTLRAIEVKISLARNLIDIRSSATSIDANAAGGIKWSQDNKFISFLSGDKKTLYTADRYGNNRVKIAEFDFSLGASDYDIVFNSSGVVIKLPENPSAERLESLRHNLYKIKFTG